MPNQKYATSAAFKVALETRLKKAADERGRPYHVLRKLVSFDRLLARIFLDKDETFALKGGYSLELRLGRSRTTLDVDLVVREKSLKQAGSIEEAIQDLLQERLEQDLNDYFSFRLGKPTKLTAATIGGFRIPVKTLLGGTQFEDFHLDVAVGETDPLPLEELWGESWLEFANIDQAKPLAIPASLQFSEKLHAYTFPWQERENTREKDLIDMAVLIEQGLDKIDTSKRVSDVFRYRNTHELPEELPEPPSSWGKVFESMAVEIGFEGTIETAFNMVKEFYRSLKL